MRAPAEHDPVARHHLAGPDQELVAPADRVGRDIVGLTGRRDPVRGPRGRRLQLPHRLGRAALGVALERLAAGLHEHDDESGERLASRSGRDDGEHRHQVGGEAARAMPRSVRQTTGAPVRTRPPVHTRRPRPGAGQGAAAAP